MAEIQHSWLREPELVGESIERQYQPAVNPLRSVTRRGLSGEAGQNGGQEEFMSISQLSAF